MARGSKGYQTASFRFPIRGIDRSMPVVEQPALTCRDLQNVRAATTAGRQSGAKRPGLAKKMANAAGGTVNCLQVVPRTVVDASAFKGVFESVDERFVARKKTTTGLQLYDFECKGDFVLVFREPEAASGGTDSIGHGTTQTFMTRCPAQARTIQGAAADVTENVGSTVFVCEGAVNADTQRTILGINYPTKNSVIMNGTCRPRASHTRYKADDALGTQEQAANSEHIQPTWYGPCVRGSGNYENCIVAYLACVGTNKARLTIDKMQGTTTTTIGSSTVILSFGDPSNPGTSWPALESISDAGFEIEITASATQVRASVRWPGQMSPQTDSITVDNADFATNERAGVVFMFSDQPYGSKRWVNRLRFQRRILNYKVLTDDNQLLGFAPPLVGTTNDRYRLGNNTILWRAKSGDPSIGTATFASGHNAATYPSVGGVARGVCADKDTGVVGADNGSGGDATTYHAIYKAAPATGRYMVDVLPTVSLITDAAATPIGASTRDSVGFISHVDSGNGNRALLYLIQRQCNSGSTVAPAAASQFSKNHGCGEIEYLRIYSVRVTAGAVAIASVLDVNFALSANSANKVIYALDAPLTFDFDGTNFRILQNGCELLSIPGASYVPVGWTNTGVVGAAFPYSTTATAVACDGVRWTQDASTVTTVTAGTDIVAIGSSGIQQADLSVGTWTTPSSTAMGTTAAPACAAINNNKVYIVDGTASNVLDPINQTVTAWNSRTGGTFPSGCQIVVNWRGRAVLARQTTNLQAWYMSALGDWENFDYGATAAATKAYTGTLGEIGQPKEPITALIPFRDDYLIFGCQNALYLMEGDPGAGGTLLPITEQVGVLNQRCWCLSDTGVLYFLGAGGLYAMQPATRQYTPVVERRVSEYLEQIDATQYVLSMQYSAVEKGLYIIRTPIGGGVGDHIFIDIPLEGVFKDQYPAAMQPLATAKLEGGTDTNAGFYLIGTDGYVRYHSRSQLSDDGTAIDSWAEIGPLELGEGWVNCMVGEVQACGVIGSGTLAWKWYVGDSPEEVMASSSATYDSATAGTSWALGGGWQYPTGLRLCAAAHKIRVANNTTNEAWSLERLEVSYQPLARRRDQ